MSATEPIDDTTAAAPPVKKPSESAFKQQKLPAWQPILTAGTVLPTFFIVGLIFIPIGIGVLHFSNKVQEFQYDYTNCKSKDFGGECSEHINRNSTQICNCEINFTLPEEFKGQVYLYYGLTNFYQNHRRYVKSRDDVQLLGKLKNEVSPDCEPFGRLPNGTPIAPCGAIANSMFNDKLTLFYNVNENEQKPIVMRRKGIAWESDINVKFKNPPHSADKTLKDVFDGFAKPPNWKVNVWELDPDDDSNNGFQNEDFIVWMRTAALPDFRKLYRIIDMTAEPTKDKLPKGSYTLKVEYNFRVTEFRGTKSIILSTTSILGVKNSFLGYAYTIVGCLCVLIGVSFLTIHLKYGKPNADIVNVNPTTSYQ